jgi:hypothetical protein
MCWLLPSIKKLATWYACTAITHLWKAILALYIIASGFIQLRIYVPLAMYIFYALVMAYLLFLYVKWIIHFVRGGYRTWWADTTVERTFPGMVRAFSLDYWSMVWGGLMWVLFDTTTGGLKMLWVPFTSACPNLVYAAHCTFSSPESNTALGVVYIVGGLFWYNLWLPTQMTYVNCNGGEEGRKCLGDINPNIAFMTRSIIGIFLILVPEIAAFLHHEDGLDLPIWQAQLVLLCALVMEFAHIGTATLLFMGIAKITATASRTGFDEYDLCFGSGW